MNEFCCAILALSLLSALTAILWSRWRVRRTLLHLDQMLDSAAQGRFTEESFEESLLSAVETKFAHYLAASAASNRQLQRERDAVKTLISDISHQTKTPIANLLLYTQLLSEQPLPPESREYTSALERQAEKLRSLISALVKTSRLESGILVLQPEPCPLMPMLESAAAQFAPQAGEKGIRLCLRPAQISALFDRKWTEEAVCNLLDNAVKYTPAGGRITIQATAYEMFCRIDIADNGPGIPEAEQAKVFQRFYRSPAVRQTAGVGIGLYLVRQIAESQGGYVKVSSPPGQGTKFSLYLPKS